MQPLTTFLFALSIAGLAWTAPTPDAIATLEKVAERAVTLQKRAEIAAILWRDAGYSGQALELRPVEVRCVNLPNFYNDVASSLFVAANTQCIFYADAGCNGNAKSYGVGNPSNVASDLSQVGFNDVISSYICAYKQP